MVDILMATFNGELYIEEQINSIINQTYKDWTLYIRDDGSNDDTIKIINRYTIQYPEKIILLDDKNKGLGAKLNFSELMKKSNSKYCMFADQDDVWLNNKIEITLKKMKEVESINGRNIPILVHTNLKVVDENLDIINDSFWKYENLNPEKNSINNIIVQNNITGCTMLMNKKLVELSKNIPKEAIMHDWWIGMIAASFGKIEFVNECTMLYRQHGKNTVGAQKCNSFKFIMNKFSNFDLVAKSINKTIVQADCFRNRFSSQLNYDDYKMITAYCTIKQKNLIERKKILLKNNFFNSGILRNIAYFILL